MSINLTINLYDKGKELKINIEKTKTVQSLINKICSSNNQLSLEYTALKFAGISLNPSKTLDELNLKDGNILQQLKKDLNEVPGLIVSYEPDMITFDSTI